MIPLDIIAWVASVVASFLFGVTYVTNLRDNDPILVVFLLIEGFSLLLAVVYGVIRILGTRDAEKLAKWKLEYNESRYILARNLATQAQDRLNGYSVVQWDPLSRVKVLWLGMRVITSSSYTYGILDAGSAVSLNDGETEIYRFVVSPGDLWRVEPNFRLARFASECIVFQNGDIRVVRQKAGIIQEIEAE
jgi:hypothetical protein